MQNLLTFFFVIAIVLNCQDKSKDKTNMDEDRQPNHLIDETSPYLLQHAYNPVDWYPWGEEALNKAKKENKLLLISIGYAACHWCHVMEHESFEDSAVAALMNDYFVNIKVDREERPDIDDIYMTACQMASGRGCGWPLNSFALPDGRPVWAGTYFPKKEWTRILEYFNDLQINNREKLEKSAEQITQGIRSLDSVGITKGSTDFSNDQFETFVAQATQSMDMKKGGRKGAPKFPMPTTLEFLLSADYYGDHQLARKAALTTLDEMAKGGIYDQIGGGFARYSVDADWLVPHFEKMLYDNGQLIKVYSEAYKITNTSRYEEVVSETVQFLEREMMSDEGGFYSSLDADSEGEEGKFYVWTEEEIDSVFSDHPHLELFKDYFNIKSSGNWEHKKNILHIRKPLEEVAKKHDISVSEAETILAGMKDELLSARSDRVRPGLDDKILCSWNALCLKGLITAYEAFGDKKYLDLALNNANFIQSAFIKEDYRLDRNYKEGRSRINAFLDDYALLIEAYISLYEVTFDDKWLELAATLNKYAIEHFYDENSGLFYYTNDIDPELIARKKELGDNVIPGSNSTMGINLLRLGHFFYNEDYIQKSRQMMSKMAPGIIESGQPNFYSNWCQLYAQLTEPLYEIAVLGEEAQERSHELNRQFLPNAIFLGGKEEGELELLKNKLQEGKTVIYVCQNKVCKLPVEKTDEALKLIE